MSNLRGIFFSLLIFGAPFLISTNLFADETWNALVQNDQTQWLDENGKPFQLSKYSGDSTVVTMVYSECRKMCPNLTLKKLHQIQSKLESKHQTAEFIIASFDPENDQPKILKAFKERVAPGLSHWHFLTASKKETQSFASKIGLGNYWNMEDHIQHDFKILFFDQTAHKKKFIDINNREVASLFEDK